MTFDELTLCIAIQNAGRCSDTPRTNQQRLELAQRVFCEWLAVMGDSVFPFSVDDIVRWDTNIRKNKDTRTKIEVAKKHGWFCFWRGRGKGPCCQIAECGHLWQRSQGGPLSVQNCVIECKSHNNQRLIMTVEEYLRSDLTTEILPTYITV
jgi:hypothetical protein